MDFLHLLREERSRVRAARASSDAPSDAGEEEVPSNAASTAIPSSSPPTIQTPDHTSTTAQLTAMLQQPRQERIDIEQWRVAWPTLSGGVGVREGCPALRSIFVIPDFISATEECALLEQLESPTNDGAWVHLKSRRLQSWGRHPDLPFQPMPPWLSAIAERLHSAAIFDEPPSHCLINAYAPGQGVLGHEDGPAYRPRVATISLGTRCVLRFHRRVETSMTPAERRERNEIPTASVVLPRRSAVVFADEAYVSHTHGIRAVLSEKIEAGVGFDARNLAACGLALGDALPRGARVSLTFRHTVCEL